MKTLLLISAIFMLALPAISGPTTNAPSVMLGWDRMTDPIVNGYKVYWGVATRNYTNSVAAVGITNNTAVVSNLARGVKYYFAATSTSTNGLESDYSLEVNYTTTPIPGPPETVVLIVVKP